MAIIETAEGQTVTVSRSDRNAGLHVTGRVDPGEGKFGKKLDLSMHDIYRPTALDISEKPRTRGDLTADKMEQVANLVVGHAVAEGWADRRTDVVIERLGVEERERVRDVSKAYVPDWEEGWPEGGTTTEKARYMLDEVKMGAEATAAALGCSRSLISEVEAGLGD